MSCWGLYRKEFGAARVAAQVGPPARVIPAVIDGAEGFAVADRPVLYVWDSSKPHGFRLTVKGAL